MTKMHTLSNWTRSLRLSGGAWISHRVSTGTTTRSVEVLTHLIGESTKHARNARKEHQNTFRDDDGRSGRWPRQDVAEQLTALEDVGHGTVCGWWLVIRVADTGR